MAVNLAVFTCCYTAAILGRWRTVVWQSTDYTIENILVSLRDTSSFRQGHAR